MNVFEEREEQLDKLAENFALDHYLSEYPQDMEYDEIIERISSDNRDDEDDETIIVIWEPFENHDPASVSEHINDLKDAARKLIDNVINSGAGMPIG